MTLYAAWLLVDRHPDRPNKQKVLMTDSPESIEPRDREEPTLRQTPLGFDLLSDSELADRWAQRWRDVFVAEDLDQVAHVQTDFRRELMFRGSPIESNAFVLSQGTSPRKIVNQDVEERMNTALASVPFISVAHLFNHGAPHRGGVTVAWSSLPMPTELWSDAEETGDGTQVVVQSIVDRAFEAAGLYRPTLEDSTLTDGVWNIRIHLTHPNHRRQVVNSTDVIAELLGARWLGVEALGGALDLHAGV